MPFALSNGNVVTRAVTEAEEQEKSDLEGIEVHLLTEGIYQHYGFDFRDYSLPSLRRRLWKRVYAEGLSTISALQEKVLHDSSCMERLLLDLSINTTAMFRDPTFYLAFRQKIVPLLRTYPFVHSRRARCGRTDMCGAAGRPSTSRSGRRSSRCSAHIRSSASGTPAVRRAKRSTRWPSCCRRKASTTAAAS